MKYELRQIDAWNDESGWAWNDSFAIASAVAETPEHALAVLLEKTQITFRCQIRIVEFGENALEVQNKNTDEPLLAVMEVM